MQTNTNKKLPPPLLQSGGKDESNIVFMRKSSRTSQNGAKNVKVFIFQYQRVYGPILERN